MKKLMYVVGAFGLVMVISGCAARSYIATKERVDIDVAGNQGVIYGPVPAPHKVANTDREVFTVDVELPTRGELGAAVKKPASQPTETAPAARNTKEDKIK